MDNESERKESGIYWKGKKIEDLTDDELDDRKKSFKMKMKIIFLSIVVEESGKREMNMILGKPDIENDPIDKEIRLYLEKMFAADEVNEKLKGIIDFLKGRIDNDEPTIMSIFKAHRDANARGEKIESLVLSTVRKDKK